MARLKKSVDVQKFGGIDALGTVKNEHDYDINSIETKSETKLEDDVGFGEAAIIRCFEYAMNPESFREYQPTKQELFNAHYKGIEVALWKDGMKVIPEVNPRIVVDGMKYKIFVGARPMKGHILHQVPQTLGQIAHG